MMPIFNLLRLSALFFLLAQLPSAYSAIPVELPGAAPTAATPELLKAKIEEVKAAAELNEKTKAKLTELYRKALSYQEQARSSQVSTEAFIQAMTVAPERTGEIRERLERVEETSATASLDVSEATPIDELEQSLLKEKADQAAVEAKLAELEKRIAVQKERPAAAWQRLTEVKPLREELAADLRLAPLKDEPPLLAEARRWTLEARRVAISAEIRMLDQELLSQQVRVDLLKAQRDKAADDLAWIGERARLMESLLSERRHTEAEQALAEAEVEKRKAKGKHPLLQRVAEQNAELSEVLSTMASDLKHVVSQDDTVKARAEQIEQEFNNARQRLEIAGLSHAIGQLLWEQRRDLPDPGRADMQARKRERIIAKSGLRQLRHDEELQRLRDIEAHADQLAAALPPEETQDIAGELRVLLDKRRDLLEKAITTDDAYLRALGELDFAEQRLAATVGAFDKFLAEHLLWIRTTPPIGLDALLALPDDVVRLVSPVDWLEVVDILLPQVAASPLFILFLFIIGVMVWQEAGTKRAIQSTRKKIGKPTTDRFVYTLQAAGLTLLAAAPWPLLMAVSGWWLGLSLEATDYSKALAETMVWLALPFYSLRVSRLLCMPHGLAAAHFRWPEPSLKLLRRELYRLMIVFLPSAFATAVVVTLEHVSLGGALGKLGFVVVAAGLAFFLYRVLHPRQGALRIYLDQHSSSLFARLRYLWFSLLVGVPLLLAGLALAGYFYTATMLLNDLINTLWLVLSLIVVQQLAEHWLLLTRRKLAYQAAIERRKAARLAREIHEPAPVGVTGVPAEVEEPEVDLIALSEETSKMLNTLVAFAAIIGLWFTWAGELPAFGMLNEVPLWNYAATVSGQEQQIPVTLADLGLAILILVVTVVAAQSLPALLEIVLLQRLDVSAGSRYAITNLSTYLIAVVGGLLAFNALGASWSQVQWLVAALSVGIGFGLQEIVANFISGLIILFERPIRVGDFVTVGDTDGVVTRIRIRATTIRNLDRKELLVPNKEFITGRLLNWSLSDPTTRILLNVGVAYGSDVRKAMSLLIEAAVENRSVLAEPEPTVIFETFGTDTLNIVLRCFVESVDLRFPTISELNQTINDKFEQAGIVIAFPQRDVHLDSIGPLDVRIRRGGEDPDSASRD